MLTFTIYAALLLLAVALVLGHYMEFRWFTSGEERIGWQALIPGGPGHAHQRQAYLTWEKYPLRAFRLDVRVERGQPYLGYQPALVVRWRGFRLVFLGRLK